MSKKQIFILLSLFPLSIIAQNSIDDKINSVMEPISKFVSNIIFWAPTIFGHTIPFVLIWLIAGAIIFTIYMGFVNVRGFKNAIDVALGKFDNPDDPGEVSHFQALTAALSGTVGLGNIAGVAVAISLGGPGATFWMIIAGFLGMSSKFVECTLGVKYRDEHEDGSVSGGPMYYLSKGLAKQNKKELGKFLAIFFSIACVFASLGVGGFSINQATYQLKIATGNSFLQNNGWTFGLVVAVLIGLIIIGGIKSIARVTDKVVPFMCGIYVVGVLIVLGNHFTDIPSAFSQIIAGAFTKNAAFGGFVGVLILGFKRGAFSNEAGIGSAPIAHSAAKTEEPISEGIVSLLEPFIDTVVICTMTALVIIITGNTPEVATKITGDSAIGLTSRSFESAMPWFPPILSVAVILFALSTMISWSYYGLKTCTYLFGETKTIENSYKIIFCVVVVIGSSISAQSVFDFLDAMIFAMAFPNIFGLYFLMKEVRLDLKEYFQRVASGEIKRYK